MEFAKLPYGIGATGFEPAASCSRSPAGQTHNPRQTRTLPPFAGIASACEHMRLAATECGIIGQSGKYRRTKDIIPGHHAVARVRVLFGRASPPVMPPPKGSGMLTREQVAELRRTFAAACDAASGSSASRKCATCADGPLRGLCRRVTTEQDADRRATWHGRSASAPRSSRLGMSSRGRPASGGSSATSGRAGRIGGHGSAEQRRVARLHHEMRLRPLAQRGLWASTEESPWGPYTRESVLFEGSVVAENALQKTQGGHCRP
jgi:hypothetical protein